MARAPFATWVGPTANRGGPMTGYAGLVVHIAEGTYLGTIAWQQNPAARVSSHFVVARDGRISQMVDTADRSWCQAAGNANWLSVENEGFHGDTPPAAQVEALAQIYAWAIRTHGIPAQITDSTAVGGLGWHGMGGDAWGGHFDCPGEGLKSARPSILARALAINGGDDMAGVVYALKEASNSGVWLSDGIRRRGVADWGEFGAMCDAGLVLRPAPGAHVDGQGASAFVLVVPDGRLDSYAGPVDEQSAGGPVTPHTHDVPASTTGPA